MTERESLWDAREGDQFYDLDSREVKKGRWVAIDAIRGDFALCTSYPSQRDVRIHLSRLTNPRLFRKAGADG